jgi:hypothetical protein
VLSGSVHIVVPRVLSSYAAALSSSISDSGDGGSLALVPLLLAAALVWLGARELAAVVRHSIARNCPLYQFTAVSLGEGPAFLLAWSQAYYILMPFLCFYHSVYFSLLIFSLNINII